MIKVLSLFFLLSNLAISATDMADPVIDEIFFLHSAEERWSEYAQRSVDQHRENLTYQEFYQEELDSWLVNELSWENIEPLFRERVKAQYSVDELADIVETLREVPSGYTTDSGRKSYGPELFNMGVAVAQSVYPALMARLATLREQYEPQDMKDTPPEPEASRPTPQSAPESIFERFHQLRIESLYYVSNDDCVRIDNIKCFSPCGAVAGNPEYAGALRQLGEDYVRAGGRSCPKAKCMGGVIVKAVCQDEMCRIERARY